MTLIELNDLLEGLTWDQMEANGETYLGDLMEQCGDERHKALVMILRWFNANRPDEGFVTVM